MLDFDGEPPNATELGVRWHDALQETASFFGLLPAEQAGACILTDSGTLFNGTDQELAAARTKNRIVFHKGHIRGAWPQTR